MDAVQRAEHVEINGRCGHDSVIDFDRNGMKKKTGRGKVYRGPWCVRGLPTWCRREVAAAASPDDFADGRGRTPEGSKPLAGSRSAPPVAIADNVADPGGVAARRCCDPSGVDDHAHERPGCAARSGANRLDIPPG